MNQLSNKTYDLGERTTIFSEKIIGFCKTLEIDKMSQIVVSQLVRCATSIGVNFMEAKNGCSKKDFINKIFICKKEAQETQYWLRIMLKCFPSRNSTIDLLSKEAHELLLIFQKTISTAKLSVNLRT